MERRTNINTVSLFSECLKILKPPLKMDIREWADTYRVLSKESSFETGKWDTNRTPYMIEIYEAITSLETEKITIMAGAQIAKTEMLLNIFGRYAHLDPCPILFVQPTVEDAKGFSKERVSPMIRDTPILRDLIRGLKRSDDGDTVQQKMFPGGYLRLVGANSPSGLASRPVKITLLDEVDRFPQSAGEEGDPVALAEKRTTTFFDRKNIRVSTPTIEGISKIKKLYLESTQEEWCLPCPQCGDYQPLNWEKVKWGGGLKTVMMECHSCGCLSSESEWKAKKQLNGKWIAKVPGKLKHRGFHLNTLASPWRNWEDIKTEFLEVKKDQERLKTFVNTVLGETWVVDLEEVLDYEAIFSNKEHYGAELHDSVLLLTAGVDVQDNRLEVEVVGWSKGYESYGVTYREFVGNPASRAVWDELDEFLKKDFFFEDGSSLKIACTCIDTGGHHTDMAYKFIKPIQNSRRVYGIKGQGGDGVAILNGFRKTKNKEIDLLSIGVNTLKDLLYGRLKILEGPGKCHYPKESTRGYGIDYFKGLTAETKRLKGNKIEWVKIRERNEPLDLRNYATAAVEILKPNFDSLERMSREQLARLSETKTAKPKKAKTSSKGVDV